MDLTIDGKKGLCLGQCDACPNKGNKKFKYIPHTGSRNSEIMLIGERGASHEFKNEVPFVGPSGTLLTKLLKNAGINRTRCFITNAVSCAPNSVRTPSKEELTACRENLLKQVAHVKPKLIILLGATALWNFYGKVTGVKDLHGMVEWHEIKDDDGNPIHECWILPTYHPSAAIQDDKCHILYEMTLDLKRARTVLDNGWENKLPDHIIHDNPDEILEFIETELKPAPEIAFDAETSTVNPYERDANIACYSFATYPNVGHVVWLKDMILNGDPRLNRVVKAIAEVLEDPDKVKIAANAKFDIAFSDVIFGMNIRHNIFDVIVADRFLSTATGEHGLKRLANKHTRVGNYDRELDEYKNSKRGFWDVPKDVLAPYAALDSAVTFAIYEKQMDLIERRNQIPVMQLSMHLMETLIDVEEAGIAVDLTQVENLEKMYAEEAKGAIEKFHQLPEVQLLEIRLRVEKQQKEVDKLKRKLKRLKSAAAMQKTTVTLQTEHNKLLDLKALEDNRDARDIWFQANKIELVNMSSTHHMGHLLYEIVGLPAGKVSKRTGKPSVDMETLKELDHESAKLVVEHRHAVKMRSTYLTKIRNTIDHRANVIHPNFVTNGTVSRRLSSGFHTYPAHGKDAILKSVFVPSFLGGYILAADLSQIGAPNRML